MSPGSDRSQGREQMNGQDKLRELEVIPLAAALNGCQDLGRREFELAHMSMIKPELAAHPAAELDDVRRAMLDILEANADPVQACCALPRAEWLAANAGGADAQVACSLLRLRERAGQHDITQQWKRIFDEHTDDANIARFYILRLVKDRMAPAACLIVDNYFPEAPEDPIKGSRRAELLADARAYDESDELSRRLIEKWHDLVNLRVAFAKRLNKRGLIVEAVDVIAPVTGLLRPGSKALQLAITLVESYKFYQGLEQSALLAELGTKIVAMKHAILHFRDRDLRGASRTGGRSVALVTGSLGLGGAERQLTRLARRLHINAGPGFPGNRHHETDLDDVEVIVRQHAAPVLPERATPPDFLLGELREAGVKVTEIGKLPVLSAQGLEGLDAKLAQLLDQLPAQVHYGVTRLFPYLRERQFDVVSLWQDGTCLLGALAALLAGTPVIHLVFRGLPPNLRTERHRPEYEVLFQAIAEVPGVHFVSNSTAVAKEYAHWLGIPVDRFHILYNGVPELSACGSPEDDKKWEEFADKTKDATETIGGVFRMEPDKRPLLWIRMAHRYLKRRPGARFIVVGDGRLFDNATALIHELGMTARILMVGLSKRVGFWYSKMDVKVLLSRHEGLPNVLIEAQMLGISVVSTPAGGAGECFLHGQTGQLLGSAEHPDLDEACEKILMQVDASRSGRHTHDLAKSHAKSLFAVETACESFIKLCELSDISHAHGQLLEELAEVD